MSTRPSPVTFDRDTAGFFEAAKEGRLVVRACQDCSKAIHPPTAHCPFCQSWNTAWRASSGKGHLQSWTVISHSIHPAFPAPTTLLLVSVEDAPGVNLIGTLTGGDEGLEADQPMEVWFETLADGAVIPQWRPLSSSEPQT